MSLVIFSCILTGIISVIISYFINVYLGNIQEKNRLVYDQLKDYSSKLSLLNEKWSEFDEVMEHWNKEHDESVAPIIWKKSLSKMNEIQNCFADYRASIHGTKNIISNNFGDGDAFVKSVYSMSKGEDDNFTEADFFNTAEQSFQLYTKGNNLPDEKAASHELNNMYGRYKEIHEYRVKVELSNAQSYIDQKLQVVSDSISKHRLSKKEK